MLNSTKVLPKLLIIFISTLTALLVLGNGSAVQAADLLDSEVSSGKDQSVFSFTGSLIELENTTPPTTILVRDTSGEQTIDYIVEIDPDTVIARRGDWSSNLAYWLVGDVLKVWGYQVNDETVHANVVINTSITGVGSWGQNGWITAIDCQANQLTVNWENQDWRIDLVPEATKIVIPPNTNATCDDLEVGDRIRGRGVKHGSLNIVQARIIFVLRREFVNYVKRNTERLNGTLIQINSNTPPTIVKIITTGDDPTEYDIRITERTRIRQRFLGPGSLDEWIVGDNITFLVKNTSTGTVSTSVTSSENIRTAVMAKNNSIWKVSTRGQTGTIIAIDYPANQFIMRWGANNSRLRIDVTENTHIVKDIINPASFSDLAIGDRVRGRGERHATLPIIIADIVVALTPKS